MLGALTPGDLSRAEPGAQKHAAFPGPGLPGLHSSPPSGTVGGRVWTGASRLRPSSVHQAMRPGRWPLLWLFICEREAEAVPSLGLLRGPEGHVLGNRRREHPGHCGDRSLSVPQASHLTRARAGEALPGPTCSPSGWSCTPRPRTRCCGRAPRTAASAPRSGWSC